MDNAELDARISAVRGFNRFYTRQIGLLRKSYLDVPFTLGEMRVLYEIGNAKKASASDIAAALGLDAGYLSRMLATFEKRGLVARARSKADGRRSELTLTAQGRRTFHLLDRRSHAEVRALLADLPDPAQARLVAAMQGIETLIGGAPRTNGKRPYILRAPRPGDYGWIIARHAALYAQEYGWGGRFEGMCAQIVADFANNNDPKRERCWIAELDGENAGSIMLVKDTADVARIRMLLVEPTARGLGIGVRLVDECLALARKARYRKVTLWTHSVLTAARNIYQRAGFKLVATEKHKSWGKPVVGETWDLEL